MDTRSLAQRVEQEIVDLHVVFEQWIGTGPSGHDRVDASLASDFLFVGPDGSIVPRSALLAALASSSGRDDVAIRISEVELAWQRGDLVCATYVENQERGDATSSRRSSVVLQHDSSAPGGFIWVSVHETSL